MKKNILILFCIAALCSLTFAQTQNSTSENKSETVNIAGTEIKMPIKLNSISMFRDGGTITAKIEDASGKKIDFCLDKVGGGEFKNIYLNTMLPNLDAENAVKLSLAGSDEKLLLKVLIDWKQRNVTKQQQDKITELSKLKGQEAYWDAIEKMSKEEANNLIRSDYMLQVIYELENRKPVKPAVEITKDSVNKEKSRKFVDEFIENLINNRLEKIRPVLDESFVKSYIMDGESYKIDLDSTIKSNTNNYGKLLRCVYSEDSFRIEQNRGKRVFWYKCDTDNAMFSPNFIRVDIFQVKANFTIESFGWGMGK
jgi:hypothetical protein